MHPLDASDLSKAKFRVVDFIYSNVDLKPVTVWG